ncbi:Energy-coupling factor transporter transmembrane protein EcfT [Mycoplasmopsis maculosa]|uniref:Energy-coupling factor transporter transmembrane protein EcfT n=1 Tax=Mycoplasmopsis maculosa TaxID=114885 RepID=A0A449B3G8_9BACT|nr:energy-coupling factor transporter transmembrane component T [Mycoplasmopsis maculosa]VEU75143.1 Energy-coupling factor transporter transmembrane protein EcfT [Mycoplasmopsis maculosa]
MNNYSRYMMNNTFVHKLDPRIKIVSTIIYIVLAFIVTHFITIAILLIPLVVLYIIATHKIKPLLKLMIMPLLIGFFLFFVNIYTMKVEMYDNAGKLTKAYQELKQYYPLPLHLGGSYFITYEIIARTLGLVARVYIMIMATTLMVNTTKPTLLSKALEDLLLPLKLLFIPTHIIVMIIYIALRFIPTLLDEANRIMKAQSSRGVDFKNGKLKDKIKSFTTLIIPLFVTAFAKAEDLSNAMETRGYDPYAKRTHYRIIIPTWRDAIISLIVIGLIVYVALLHNNIINLPNWYIITNFNY